MVEGPLHLCLTTPTLLLQTMGNKLLVILLAIFVIAILGFGFYIGYGQVFGPTGAPTTAQVQAAQTPTA